MEEGKHYSQLDTEIVRTELEKKKKGYGLWLQLLIFTVIFLITAAGAYSYFIMGNSTFLTAAKDGNKDGAAQIYPSYVAVKHIIQGLLAGEGFSAWNWSIGLGGDNWNMFSAKLANPFTYLIIAAPEDKMDIAYTLVAVLRQYCAGVAFMFLGKRAGLDHFQNIIGGLTYSFSMWMIMTVTAQSGFDNAAILFPLLVLGAEKICEGESPFLFIISVFFLLSSGVIWGYASGIMIIIYYLVRQILNGEIIHFGRFLKISGRFIVCGLTGILLASFFVASIFFSMQSASHETGAAEATWFTMRQYLSAPIALFKAVSTGAPSYSAIGLPVIGIILMPMIFGGIFRRHPQSVMALACLAGTQIPFVCRMFNGFSYASGRWFYMVAFFMTWATIENLNEKTFGKLWKCLIMELWLVVTSGWVIMRYFYFHISGKKTALAAIAGLMAGTFIVIVGHIKYREYKNPGGFTRFVKSVAAVLITMAVMVDAMEISVLASFSHAHDGVEGYAYVGEIYEGIHKSGERVIPQLQEADPEFFRSDHKGGYYGIKTTGAGINENILFGNRSVYTCFSSAPSAWHQYNRAVGNCAGNYRRTLIQGNDNRAMLDYLMGVKYFVGNSINNEIDDNFGSDYVPYGYTKYGDVDGYEVFVNNHCMGLGTTYTQYITESEFEQYPSLAREQVLMETAVVPDEYADKIEGVKHADPKDIITDETSVDYEIVETEGMTFGEDGHSFTINDPDKGAFRLVIPEVHNAQIIVAIENLRRKDLTYEEYNTLLYGFVPDEGDNSLPAQIRRRSFKDDTSYKIKVEKENIKKAAKCENGGVRGINDLIDFDINLGYFDYIKGKIKVTIDDSGYYTYDNIKVYAIPMENYDANAEILDSRKYQITTFTDDYVDGTISSAEDSILYLSILRDKGWSIYIDGEKAEKIEDVNISFTGTRIPAGEHRIELRYAYPHFWLIAALTCLGLIMLIIVMVIYHRRKHEKA